MSSIQTVAIIRYGEIAASDVSEALTDVDYVQEHGPEILDF